MANEFYTGLTVGTDAFVAVIVRKMALALGDRAAGAILQNPIIASSFGSANKLGALAQGTLIVGYGLDKFDAVAEGTPFTNTALSSDQQSVTTARRGLMRTVSDMARSLDHLGATGLANYVMDGIWGFQRSMVDLFASLFTSISASVGSVVATLTWGTMKSAATTLDIANVAGPYVCILASKAWGELSADALTLGGAVQRSPEQLAYMGQHGLKYKGRYLNGDVDIYTSDEIDNAGGGFLQGMFGAGFMNWDIAMATPSAATIVIANTPLFLIEMSRTATKTEDAIISSTNAGAAIIQNAAGVKILSKLA